MLIFKDCKILYKILPYEMYFSQQKRTTACDMHRSNYKFPVAFSYIGFKKLNFEVCIITLRD